MLTYSSDLKSGKSCCENICQICSLQTVENKGNKSNLC